MPPISKLQNYYADTFNFTQQDDEENLDEKPPLQDFILVIICFGVGIIGIILVIVAFRYTQCGRRVCFNQRNENNINRDIREQGLGDGIIVVRRGSNIQVQNLDNKLNEILKLAPEHTFSQVKKKDQLQQTCCVICLGEYMNENKVRWLNCDHIFHSQCLIQWIKRQLQNQPRNRDPQNIEVLCPSCKQDLQKAKSHRKRSENNDIHNIINSNSEDHNINLQNQQQDQIEQQHLQDLIYQGPSNQRDALNPLVFPSEDYQFQQNDQPQENQ